MWSCDLKKQKSVFGKNNFLLKILNRKYTKQFLKNNIDIYVIVLLITKSFDYELMDPSLNIRIKSINNLFNFKFF